LAGYGLEQYQTPNSQINTKTYNTVIEHSGDEMDQYDLMAQLECMKEES